MTPKSPSQGVTDCFKCGLPSFSRMSQYDVFDLCQTSRTIDCVRMEMPFRRWTHFFRRTLIPARDAALPRLRTQMLKTAFLLRAERDQFAVQRLHVLTPNTVLWCLHAREREICSEYSEPC